MGTRVKTKTLVEASDPEIWEIEYEEGFAPWSPHSVIQALVAEVQRLRGELFLA
jgi:hypothetical protein